MNGLAHHNSVSTERDVAPICGTWFACLEDGNASLRIAHKDILGVTADGQPCFSVKSAAHAIQFIRVRASLFIGHRAGTVRIDGEETQEFTRVAANSRVQLGALSLRISSEPLSSNDLVTANDAAKRAKPEVMSASDFVPEADRSNRTDANAPITAIDTPILVPEPIPSDRPHTANVSVLPSKQLTKPELTSTQIAREPSQTQDQGQDQDQGDGFAWPKLAYLIPVMLLGLVLTLGYFTKQHEAFPQPTVSTPTKSAPTTSAPTKSAPANSGLVERPPVIAEQRPKVALPDLPVASVTVVEPALTPLTEVVNEPEFELTESLEVPATLATGVPQDSQQAGPNETHETIAVEATTVLIEQPVVAEVEPTATIVLVNAEPRPAPDLRPLPTPTAAALMAAAGQALNRGDAIVAKRLLDEALLKAPADARINKLHRQLSYILTEVSVQSEQQENIQ